MADLGAGEIALAVSAAGAAASVGGSAYSAVSAVQQADFQQKIAQQNAQAAQQQAGVQEQQYRIQARQQQGAAIAAYGASGADVSGGSPLEVLGNEALTHEQNALLIRAGGQSQQRQQLLNAQMYGMQATNAGIGGGFSVAGAGLSGAGNTLMVGGLYGGFGDSAKGNGVLNPSLNGMQRQDDGMVVPLQ